jgi:eukaryotic-like serine/threonine-protein kinase
MTTSILKTPLVPLKPIRARQMIGKYRVEKRVGKGGFSSVYAAYDTIEGIRVALKIPHEIYVTEELLESFKKEVRLVAKLDHPHILQLKDANMLDGRLVVVTQLGTQTLQDRLKKRVSVEKAYDYAAQLISAVAYAHRNRLIHCDIKPENIILFNDHLRLGDFGIAKVSLKTIQGSGTGTVGHIAPEQAMGRPSTRSDVFSVGLILYRMLTGYWPEYPFDWPFPGAIQLRKKSVYPEMIALIRKTLNAKPNDRFADAMKMEKEYKYLLPKALAFLSRKRSSQRK